MPRLRWIPTAVALVILVAGCAEPPASMMVQSASAEPGKGDEKPAGTDQVGEACYYQPSNRALGADFSRSFDLFCGSWAQPSGRIFEAAHPVAAGELATLASGSAWRSGLEQRYTCGHLSSTQFLGGAPAALLQCTQRSGGWPHAALVTTVAERTFFVDGVPSATPALATAIAGISGIAKPSAAERTSAAQLISSAIAAKPFGSGDLDDYYRLKHLGDEANDEGEYAEAEQAYRAALAIQEKFLSADSGGLAVPLMNEALQISNQNRFGEADKLLARAEELTAKQPDPMIKATLELYLAEHQANQGNLVAAMKGARAADADFRDFIPFAGPAGGAAAATGGTRRAGLDNLADSLFLGPEEQSAVSGLASTMLFEAYLDYRTGNYAAAESYAGDARRLLKQTGLNPPGVVPRIIEIAGLSAAGQGDLPSAQAQLTNAVSIFQISQADKRRAAKTLFLQGRTSATHGDTTGALKAFREGALLLRQEKVGLPDIYVEPYLEAIQVALDRPEGTVAAGDDTSIAPVSKEALAKEMFDAFQLIDTGETSKMLAEAFARLSTTKGGGAVRTMQDADEKLKQLTVQLDVEENKPPALIDAKAIEHIKKQIREAEAKQKDAEGAAMAASPEYAQVVHSNAPATAIQAVLGPDEGLIAYQVGEKSTYAVLIGHDGIVAFRVPLDSASIQNRVRALRRTIEPDETAANPTLPVFDVAAAYRLDQALLGPAASKIERLKRLIVVPSGPLTALPLEVLVTAPTKPVTDGNYAQVPFLVEKLALSYFPSPQNFLVLRKTAKASAAAEPYIGFGDFHPATPQQIAGSFPPDRCASDYEGLKDLPPLPGTRREVTFVGSRLFGVPDSDIVLGDDFTKKKLMATDLSRYRIIHLATHALLPTDLHCRAEPTIVVSVPADAVNADSGFLGFSDILALKLDADLVILSACNTGPNGKSTGDGLSALARGFFFSGSRGLLVTHWELSDASGPLLTALTLRANLKGGDTAQALQDAKLSLIHDVSKKVEKNGNFFTHPFAWAPFVLVGEGFKGGGQTS